MSFTLFGNCYTPSQWHHAAALLSALRRHGARFYIARDFFAALPAEVAASAGAVGVVDELPADVDIVLSMGGDGTFLETAARVGRSGVPIIGVNTGRLGFLADVKPSEVEAMVEELLAGRFLVEERTVLGLTLEGGTMVGYPYALNDIAVMKHDTSAMIRIQTWVNGSLLTTYQGDGLVVATPTGSTAYSLSVGGPIMVPQAGTVVLTPIAPHSLNVRPIVLRDDWEIVLEVESRSHNFLVAVDGRNESFGEGTRLRIRKGEYRTRVVKREGHDFFGTLRDKMMWGGSLVD